MNAKVITLVSTAIALFVALCSNSPTESTRTTSNESTSFSNLSSEVLIELPSSIALEPTSGPVRSKTAASVETSKNIYDGIRAYIGFANYLVNNNDFGVRAMIGFWRDTLNWSYIREVGTVTGSEGKLTWTATYDSTLELAYQLIVTENDIQPNPVVLKIYFNGRFLLPKGRVYYNVGLFEDSQSDSLEIEVSFDKQFGNRSLHVAVTGCKMDNIDDPRNIDLSLYATNGIIHVSGSSYHPGINSIISGVTGHCHTFVGVPKIPERYSSGDQERPKGPFSTSYFTKDGNQFKRFHCQCRCRSIKPYCVICAKTF